MTGGDGAGDEGRGDDGRGATGQVKGNQRERPQGGAQTPPCLLALRGSTAQSLSAGPGRSTAEGSSK